MRGALSILVIERPRLIETIWMNALLKLRSPLPVHGERHRRTGFPQDERFAMTVKAGLAVGVALALVAGAAAPALARGGDICKDGLRSGAGPAAVQCLAYPRRIGYHRANCHWVRRPGAGGAAFEMCRGHDGVWRPSGRG
jgi:hypothetical protein